MRDPPDMFPERLKIAMQGYDRAEVLEAIGSCPRSMDYWLTGARQPLAGTLGRIAWALDVSADWLLGLSDVRQPYVAGV